MLRIILIFSLCLFLGCNKAQNKMKNNEVKQQITSSIQSENNDDQISLTSLQSEIQNGLTGGTVTNVSTAITQIKELETNIQNRTEEIKELEGESNKVKVVAYLLDNESGSKKTKEFTYGENGLT